jgi:hypothetical protein
MVEIYDTTFRYIPGGKNFSVQYVFTLKFRPFVSSQFQPAVLKLIASRPIGRPKIRFIDSIMKDIQTMNIFNLESCAQDRTNWKSIVEQAKIHIEL